MKDSTMERRSFFKYGATATVASGQLDRPIAARAGQKGTKMSKALQFWMLPKNLSNADKFKLAKECGFEGIEGSPMDDLTVAEEIGKMARDAGVPIHSILYGYSQDWIRTLGKRIVKIHLKDFKRKGYQCTNLLEGVVNFKQVRLALEEVGYDGFLTPELSGGDKAYLTDLSERIDLILAM